MITAGLPKKKKTKSKEKKVEKTRGDLMVQDDLVNRLKFLEPAQVQVWIPDLNRIRQLVIQVGGGWVVGGMCRVERTNGCC